MINAIKDKEFWIVISILLAIGGIILLIDKYDLGFIEWFNEYRSDEALGY